MIPKIILDTRRVVTKGPNKGKYHIKIKASITVFKNGRKGRVVKRAKTKVYASPAEFESIMGSPRAVVLQEKRNALKTLYRKAEDICKLPGLTPKMYLDLMESRGNFESVTGLYTLQIEKMKKEDRNGNARDGNAIALRDSMRFFCRYKLAITVGYQNITEKLMQTCQIAYAEITREWLDECKAWALSDEFDAKGNKIRKKISPASFGMYARGLRSIMNLAHDPYNKITKESIPFGTSQAKFKMPKPKKRDKESLQIPTKELIAEKNKILTHVSADARINKSLNYWRATFWANGCNPADIAYMKIGSYNKEKQVIKFERKKTENTEEGNEPIVVLVENELRDIIQVEGNKSVDPDEYLFPILTKGMSSEDRKSAIQNFLFYNNKMLKKAAKEMGLKIPLSPGSARYLYSTILDRLGLGKVIPGQLGHNQEETKEHYVADFFQEIGAMINKMLRAG